MNWRPESASAYEKKLAGSNHFLMEFLRIVIFGARNLNFRPPKNHRKIMKISETCMEFGEESIFDPPGVPKLDPRSIFKKSAG